MIRRRLVSKRKDKMSASSSRRSLLNLAASFIGLVLGQRASALAAADDDSDPIIEHALRPWRGDLDGMLERGMIRVATVGSLATYFFDGFRSAALPTS